MQMYYYDHIFFFNFANFSNSNLFANSVYTKFVLEIAKYTSNRSKPVKNGIMYVSTFDCYMLSQFPSIKITCYVCVPTGASSNKLSLFTKSQNTLSLTHTHTQAVCKELDAIAELMHSNEEDCDNEEHDKTTT